MKQLSLPMSLETHATFDNFYAPIASTNAQVKAGLSTLSAADQTEPFWFLWGAHHVGVSHLLQAAVHNSPESSVYLSLSDMLSHEPESVFENIECMSLVALDDVDCIKGLAEWEEALFHAFNRLLSNACSVVMGAKRAPIHLGIELPDLQSRLSSGLTFKVIALDEKELPNALSLRARRYGLTLSQDVIHYLLHHTSRDQGDLFKLLATLDQTSLAHKRKITVPLVKLALNQ